MTVLICLMCATIGLDLSTENSPLLERASQLEQKIEQAKVEGKDVRTLYRDLLEICTRLRRATPTSLALCMNEGNAASLAHDWAHALLAYRLAQRLNPADREVEARLSFVTGRLQVTARQPLPQDEVAFDLATKPRVRWAFWTLAILLYLMAWLRIAGAISGQLSAGLLASAVAMTVAGCLAWSIYWSDEYRERMLGQPIAVVRRGEPAYLREGNGLSYPTVVEDRLRPGTEVRLLGKRGDWLHVRTASGLVGWTPAAAAEVE